MLRGKAGFRTGIYPAPVSAIIAFTDYSTQ